MAANFCNLNEKVICADQEAAERDSLDVKFVENLKLEEGSNAGRLFDAQSSKLEQQERKEAKDPDESKMPLNANPELHVTKDHLHDKEFMSSELVTESGGDDMTINNEKPNKAVAFSIPVENCCSCRQPPKRLCSTKRHGKSSIESLNKKQALADERRQKHKENRLQRIHERQEAARKLAQNVDTLLQQRALAQGVADGAVKRLSPSEILATAHLVSKNFRAITCQLGNDLEVKDKERERSKGDENQNERVHFTQKKYPTSVAFTVSCGKGNSPAKPRVALKQHQKQKRTLTAEELEEKQRQAEERRNKKKQLRAQRARENREALMAMATDLEKFKKLQSATASPNKDGDMLEQNKEAAMLAEKLASQFDRLNQRYSDDLKRAENFKV